MTVDWRHMPPLTALRALEAVARLGGFSAAARALNVTHAAVAQQVRGLETELGVALLRREGRAVVLTAEGARLAAALAEGFRHNPDGRPGRTGPSRRRSGADHADRRLCRTVAHATTARLLVETS